MKGKLQKIIWDFLYNHPMVEIYCRQREYQIKKEVLEDLCRRVPLDKMIQMCEEAKRSDQKYITLARLMEENFN